MKKILLLASLCAAMLAGCSSSSVPGLSSRRTASHGEVTISFAVPVQQRAVAAHERRPQYFSAATTTLALALKTVNGSPPAQSNVQTLDLSKICRQSGAFYYCSTTVTEVSGDNVIGALAYSSTALGTLPAPVPLSFGEGEVIIASGSSAEPAGAEDTTGRLQITLAPVIYGGQVEPGASPKANDVPITLAAFVDPSTATIPANAYQAVPPFANTPYLIDSDASGQTYLENTTSGQRGSAVAIDSPGDAIVLHNTAKEATGKVVTARLTFGGASSTAAFSIPGYFNMTASVTPAYTIKPPNSTAYLTYSCTSAGCTREN